MNKVDVVPSLKRFIKQNFGIVQTIRGLPKKLEALYLIRRLVKMKREILLEVGSNIKGKNGWTTIDLGGNGDISWDLRNGLPFSDGTVKMIYSSHFFEHLSFRESQAFLDECLRVLVPGGIFSVAIPDASIFIEAYMNSKQLDEHLYFGYESAYNNTTRIDYVNYMAYMDGLHKYMFDKENLVFILKSRGFRNVRLREFQPTLDLAKRDFETIYAEGVK